MSIDDVLNKLLEKASRAYYAALERACEQSIQSGTAGVRVVEHGPGHYTITVTDEVRYGTIEYVKGEHA